MLLDGKAPHLEALQRNTYQPPQRAIAVAWPRQLHRPDVPSAVERPLTHLGWCGAAIRRATPAAAAVAIWLADRIGAAAAGATLPAGAWRSQRAAASCGRAGGSIGGGGSGLNGFPWALSGCACSYEAAHAPPASAGTHGGWGPGGGEPQPQHRLSLHPMRVREVTGERWVAQGIESGPKEGARMLACVACCALKNPFNRYISQRAFIDQP